MALSVCYFIKYLFITRKIYIAGIAIPAAVSYHGSTSLRVSCKVTLPKLGQYHSFCARHWHSRAHAVTRL